MDGGFWMMMVIGLGAVLAGLAIALHALYADLLRRKPRKPACHRCGYDMATIDALTCPECGRTHKTRDALTSTPRRWRLSALGVVLSGFGFLVLWLPFTTPGFWHAWLPRPVLVFAIPYTTENPWAAAELLRRQRDLRPREGDFDVRSERVAWSWPVLAPALVDTLQHNRSTYIADDIWELLAHASTVPAGATDEILRDMRQGSVSMRTKAAERLMLLGTILSDEQLTVAVEALQSLVTPADIPEKASLRDWARSLRDELERRASPGRDERLRAIRRAARDPERLAELLPGSGPAELEALYGSLGLERSALTSLDLREGVEGNRVETHDIHLDDDDRVDRILTISRAGDPRDWDALAFIRTASGWRFAGRTSLGDLAAPPRLRTLEASDGRRWLVIRRVKMGIRRPNVVADLWCRWSGERLERVAWLVPTDLRTDGPLVRLYQSGEPTVEVVEGRTLARYPTIVSIHMMFAPLIPESSIDAAIGIETGVESYPLDGSDRIPADRAVRALGSSGPRTIVDHASAVVRLGRELPEADRQLLIDYLTQLPSSVEINAIVSSIVGEASG